MTLKIPKSKSGNFCLHFFSFVSIDCLLLLYYYANGNHSKQQNKIKLFNNKYFLLLLLYRYRYRICYLKFLLKLTNHKTNFLVFLMKCIQKSCFFILTHSFYLFIFINIKLIIPKCTNIYKDSVKTNNAYTHVSSIKC